MSTTALDGPVRAMSNCSRVFIWTASCLFASACGAYELSTHDHLTQVAFDRSSALNDGLYGRLGIDGTIRTRVFPAPGGLNGIARTLVSDGAVREDDVPRFTNHFFNPWTGSGSIGYAAPDWILGESPLILFQQWSYANARATLYLGLTSPTTAERDRNIGEAFASLGHVAHLLQDMAQPQHVRSDLHFSELRRTRSRYEFWVDKHLFDQSLLGALNYPNVYSSTAHQLTTTRSFFHTGTPATVSTGKGIAEFTTRNFVSAGTNFTGTSSSPVRNANFPLPDAPFVRGDSARPFNDGLGEVPPNAVIEFLGTTVTDALLPEFSGTNTRTTSFSLFDQDLEKMGNQAVFTLNQYNFLPAARNFLLPRAVAYSAGLFDYFFRGDVDLRPDPAHSGRYVIANNFTEDMRGQVALYYDAVDGTRKQVPGALWNDMAIPAKDATAGGPGTSAPISFQQPADIAAAGKYLLVFRGDMGDERRGDQFTNGAQGAVIGQVVTAPPLEGLYVSGLDSNGRLITLRVDERGTHLLSGPDSTGTLQDSREFDPLRSLGTSGTLNQRGYYIKQAKFLDPDATQYRIQAFSGPGSSFVRNAFTDKLTTGVAPGWVAQSADPTIGAFFFTPNVSRPNAGSLTYTRTYIDTDGKLALAAGTLPLPPLPHYDAATPATAYDAFNFNTKLVVSESGLRVQGLRTTSRTLSPSVTWDTSTPYPRSITTIQYEISLVLGLAETPSVTAVIDGVTARVEAWDHTSSSSATNPYYGGSGGSGCLGFSVRNDIADVKDSYSISAHDKLWIGQMEGTVHVIDIDQNDSSASDSSHDWHWDVSAGANCAFTVAKTTKSHDDSASLAATTYQLRDGGVASTESSSRATDDWLDPLPLVQNYDCRSVNWPVCSISGGSGTMIHRDTGPLENDHRRSIERAFTAASAGVVWRESPAPEIIRFRGTDITGKSFVGDASPLGEVFFATNDMSMIVHDVKNGRMPQFVPPPNMVRIVAALWL